MVDIHCHILPAVDDGSANMNVTKKMLSLAVEEGIDTIIATSHFEGGATDIWYEAYKDAFREVQDYLQESGLPLKIYPGSEVFYTEGILSDLGDARLCSMNRTPYLLVEFPFESSFDFIQRAVSNVLYEGYWPILAHIERYEALKNVKQVKELVEMGAYIQVNTSTIAGKRGWMAKRYCLKLMKSGLLHFVGSDAHGCERRTPQANDAVCYMEKKMGKAYTQKITETNPQKMIKGARISGED